MFTSWLETFKRCRRLWLAVVVAPGVVLLHGCAPATSGTITFTRAMTDGAGVMPLDDGVPVADGVALRGFSLDQRASGDWLPRADLDIAPSQETPAGIPEWYLQVSIAPAPDLVSRLPPEFIERGVWQLQVPLGAPCESSTPYPGAALPGAEVSLAVVRTDASGAEVRTEHAGPVCDLGRITSRGGAPNVFIRDASFEADHGLWKSLDSHDSAVAYDRDHSFSGLQCLSTGPGYAYNTIAQEVATSVSQAGRQLTVRAWAKAREPGTCRIAAILGGKKFYSPCHPGDGSWRPLALTVQVPGETQDSTITVGLVHNGNPAQACSFDAVSAELQDVSAP